MCRVQLIIYLFFGARLQGQNIRKCNAVADSRGPEGFSYHSYRPGAARQWKFTDQTHILTLTDLFYRSSQVLCRHWTKIAVHAGCTTGQG